MEKQERNLAMQLLCALSVGATGIIREQLAELGAARRAKRAGDALIGRR